jgi:RNA polymerase sigma-70 factor (ECF subfamily)
MDNKDALSNWVNDYTTDLYARAVNKVSDKELAADLVQETFLAAAEKINAFRGESNPKTWLFSILNNKIIDHYRQKVKRPIQFENNTLAFFFGEDHEWKENRKPGNWQLENETNLLDDDSFNSVLKQCLDALPETWGICVKLKYLSERKGDDICQELDISTSNYWQIIHRAKLQLRDCIDKNWFK